MLDFPRLRQVDGFDCGVASSKSVLNYYEKDAEYQEIMALAGTNESGTSVKGIIETLTTYGLDCKEKKMRIREIREWIKRGNPIIIPLQAWSENQIIDYKSTWTDGHYVVAIGFDDIGKRLFFSDPSSDPVAYLTYNEFKKRWHDIGNEGDMYRNYGIIVRDRRGSFSNYDKGFDPATAIHLD
jgi:ABC-type bacteriocin/lantibiotic exporter with double-glycine peptidase domain